MRDSLFEPCAFCRREDHANVRVESEWITPTQDAVGPAGIPKLVLCTDCASDVSDYLTERAGLSSAPQAGRAPFGTADADAICERLERNEHLVLQTGRGHAYGIRWVDGEWRRAIVRLPGPGTVEPLEPSKVRDMILDAKSLTLKHIDPSAWQRFERGNEPWPRD